MADNTTTAVNPLATLADPAMLRRLSLLAGLALSISIGVTAAFWMNKPGYSLLFSNIGDREAGEVVQQLTASAIPYRLERQSGAIMVPPDRVHDARLALAAQGLPRSSGFGLEIIANESGLSSSQFMENARYHHALETELSRTIGNLRPVQGARVHLAIPKSSVFLRRSAQPTASVLLHLYSGRSLDDTQVASIVHLVASSIPDLEASRVTVVDQQGRLLNSPDSSPELAASGRQFDHVRRLEESYVQRIENLLTPMLGPNRVRATVTAELDFTLREETREQFDPSGSVVRSEQLSEDRRSGEPSAAGGGVPGALSNQPPGDETEPLMTLEAGGVAATSMNETIRHTRNFEVDRTLTHAKQSASTLRRLSAAVLIDERQVIDPDGTLRSERLSPAELDEVNRLVRDAIGFDETRGDSISVSNIAFYTPPPVEDTGGPGFLADPGSRDLLRQLLAGLVVVAVVLLLVKPTLAALALAAPSPAASAAAVAMAGPAGGMAPLAAASAPLSFDDKLSVARQLADHNPERVAQIVSRWVQSDD